MTDRIERELELPAAPESVWLALTEAELLSRWLADEAELDLRPGGEASFRLGDQCREGWVEAVTPPAAEPGSVGRLIFWWGVAEEPASRVELTLLPTEAGHTRLRIVETRPLDVLDLVGLPLHGQGGAAYGPALLAC